MTAKNSLFVLLIFIGFACKTGQNGRRLTPEKTSELFFKHLNNNEFDKAKELGTEHTIKIVKFIETLSNMGGGDKILLMDNKSEFVDCVINGREAICNYKTYDGGIQKVYLLKQKGRWLVDLRKDPREKLK
ncbi:MAG: hypothetical protein PHR81_07150 [Bacteroidales bacterium]|jgi:hypothetical protein|nr:hypothetical protein [Bacteroidales bacterium]MDD4214573.1 hypothetical protein [Bacteroidales bacterium]